MNYKSNDINVAIKDGDLEKIQLILDAQPNLLTIEYFGVLETPLHYCARYGNLNVFKIFVKQGLDVNISLKGYETPLNVAGTENNIEIASWLLEHGAEVNGIDSCLLSPLMSAITFGHFEMVKLLVSHGSNVNRMHVRNGMLPLDIAMSRKDPEIADYLKSHQAKSHYILPEWVEKDIPGSGILSHVTLQLGKILPVDVAAFDRDEPVVQKLVPANNKKNRVLFTFGLFDLHAPMLELFIVLPEYWNFYVQTAENQFPIQLLSGITQAVKEGMALAEGDYILAEDHRFKALSWPKGIAAFCVVDVKWPGGKNADQNLVTTDHDKTVSLYTLLPVRRTKSGFTEEPIEKARLAGWKKLTLNIQ